MRITLVRMVAITAVTLLVACTKPEPPPTEQPPEPQAESTTEDTADATELRDAIREPIERAEAVEGAVLEAAEQQQDAIDAATGG